MRGRRRKQKHGICCQGPKGKCVSLASIGVAQEAVITSFDALNGEASRLRDLGIREGSRVRTILSGPNQMIIAVDQSRVGLPRTVADLVRVRRVTSN